jgi:phosphocarrier protein HPr
MTCRDVVIANKLGLHARASAKFVKLASAFECDITLSRNGQTVNAKSIMGIMMLAAGKGTRLELCTNGKDEQEAIEALVALIDDLFGEDE